MHLVKLKAALFARREPQYVLAARVGMTETRLSRIIQGRIPPSAEERAAIANALGLPQAEVFEEDVPSPVRGPGVDLERGSTHPASSIGPRPTTPKLAGGS